MTAATLYRWLVPPLLILFGLGFAWKLVNIPSRVETAAFIITAFLIPTLKYPRFGVYYLFCVPFFIPLFRRMYYLISARPELDYLMLISDGVMGGLIATLALLWIINKERTRDPLPILVVAYTTLLFLKVFVGNQGSTVEGLYGFKFNGLYVMFFFAGSYILTTLEETRKVLVFASWMLLITALYGINHILFGFNAFEQKWLDSITFTTLRIDGVVRPFSTYVSPAAMSDGMVILIALGAFWIVSKNRKMTIFGIFLAAAAVPPLLIATVRTNWLAAMAGLFFFLVYLRIEKRWLKIAMLLAMLSGTGFMIAKGGDAGAGQTLAMSQQLNKKNRNLTEIMIKNRTQALANPLQEYSVQKRMEIWTGIWYYSHQFPFGRGQGTNGYAHSYYFQILGEIGYPGILCFLGILVLTFRRGFHVVRTSADPAAREMARLLLTILFMLTVLNLTGTHLHTSPGDLFFWFSAGVLARLYRDGLPAPAGKAGQAAAGASPNPGAGSAGPGPSTPQPSTPGPASGTPGPASGTPGPVSGTPGPVPDFSSPSSDWTPGGKQVHA